jgi:hypothetical protein
LKKLDTSFVTAPFRLTVIFGRHQVEMLALRYQPQGGVEGTPWLFGD